MTLLSHAQPPAGDWNADEFQATFLDHYGAIYRHLFRLLGSPEEAEDLAQETFLRLYYQRFPPGQEHNVRAWLYRVATHLAYNALRSQRRRERRERQEATETEPPTDADPTEAALREEEREVVRRALGCLRPREAQLLLLRYAGASYREIAEVLGVAPGSVGTLLARAEAAFERAYRAMVPATQEEECREM